MADNAPDPVPPGWYPDPKMVDTQRYWDGQQWTENVAPQSQSDSNAATSSQVLVGFLLAASVGGLILSQQSVSLMTGSSIIWVGTAICIAAAIVCRVVSTVPTWTWVICVLIALLALASSIYVESELSDRREELSNLLQ